MAATASKPLEFSLAQSRRIVGDLFRPNPWIYWLDCGISIGVGHVLFLAVAFLPALLPEPAWLMWSLRGVGFIAYGFLYYRAAMFIHELVHLRGEEFRGFRFFWNWLCGCTFLMPSFVYYTHLDHHRRKHYGTVHDGEYIALTHLPRYHILMYLGQTIIIPALAVFRFVVLTPLAWLSPAIRRLVHERASSMVMDPAYIRPLPTRQTMRVIMLQELVCFLWCVVVIVLLSTVLRPWAVTLLVQAYLTGIVIIGLNAVRSVGAHRFDNDGGEMTFIEQMLDSVNYPRGGILTELWAPVGTRYHALHHLFPSMPYHSLAEAHRRLIHELPGESAYRLTEESSLSSALRKLWHHAGLRAQGAAPPREAVSSSPAER